VTVDTIARTVKVRVEANVPTSFMKFVGIGSVLIAAESTALRGKSGPVYVALVLDATNSMSTPFGGSTRMQALKNAAQQLVNAIMDPPNEGSQIGIVPFTSYVDLNSKVAETWINVLGQSVTTCSTFPKPECWGICMVDGVARECKIPSLPGCVPTGCTTKYWDGCLGPRASGYRDRIDSVDTVKYPGVIATCAPPYLMLSGNKTTISTRITSLRIINQETYIPSGLVWGWNMLTPEAPLIGPDPTELKEQKSRRALILITDGASTVTPRSAGTFVEWPKFPAEADGDPNQITASLCKRIVDQDIEIYTVMIDVKDEAHLAVMRACPQVPNRSFVSSNSTQLTEAFQDIGRQLEGLRLVQ
jgi:hypothetical protein